MIRIACGAVTGALLGLLVVSIMRGDLPPLFAAAVMIVVGTVLAAVAIAFFGGAFDGVRRPSGERSGHGWREPPAPPWLDRDRNHNPAAPGTYTTELNPPPQPPPTRRPDPQPPPVAATLRAGGHLAQPPQVEERAPQSAAVHIWNGWSGGQTAAVAPGEPTPRHVEQAAPAPPDVRAYGRDRRVVQCPRCVSLRINVQQHPDGLAFQCAECAHSWGWTPGGRWPPVTSGLPARSAAPSTDAF